MKYTQKAVAERDGLDFVMSDATVDSYGDIVDPKGWDLSRFEAGNPIALFAHDSKFVIGTWANVRVKAGKLIGTLKLAKQGTSYRINEIISLVEQGILKAVSVGFEPLESEPLDPSRPNGPQRFKRQRLLECSLVAIPANPAALQIARSLNVSDEIMSLAFGENAGVRRRDLMNGEQADNSREEAAASPVTKAKPMKTVSQRLEEAQNKLAACQQRQTEILDADDLDADALDAVSEEIEALEKEVAALSKAESRIGKSAGSPAAPSVNRRPLGFPKQEVKAVDLMVRKAVVNGVALMTDKAVEKVLEERYPGHEATAAIVKADPGIATTTGSHYVDDLQQTTYQGFIDALDGMSVFPAMRNGGLSLNLDRAGTAYVPGVTAGGANGSFFAEGAPIRVGKITTTSATMTSRKLGVILPFTREAAKRSTPDLEALFRRRILADTAAVIDSALLDNVAQDSVRPGGLLNGVAATASGYGGGDHLAVVEDFKALLQPFIDANAADGITVIMNPKQGFAMDAMVGPDGSLGDWFSRIRARFNFVESTHATAGRLIAVRTQDFASAVGAVEFELSKQATIHMEDTSPQPIAEEGSPNVVAAPVRSFFQTDSMGIRMVMDINWKMLRSGMVRWIDGTSY